ncbi:MAG: SUMF1/EgtB/PvdO family nonheme iron enzyme [Planctomycetaceae bacterium]
MADLLARCQSELQHNGQVTCVERRSGTADTEILPAQKLRVSGAKKKPFGWLVGGVLAVVAVIGFVVMNSGKETPDPNVTSASGNTTSGSTTKTPADPTTTTGWHGWPADAPAPAIAPFDAGQAKKHQEEWAKYLGVPVEYENSIGMKFRLIPPGEFLMGKTPSEVEAGVRSAGEDVSWRERAQAEGPQHKVILTQPIYVSTTEVTQSQYEQVMELNPAYFSAGQEGGDLVADLDCGKLPVEMVSWHDAGKFCDRLSLRNQLTPFYTQPDNGSASIHGSGYRLPTEAEWEWACRAGTTTRFWPGNSAEELSATAWFNSNSAAHTHYVGELKPNPFGLADMHGNVWEWVQDTWDPTFYASFSGSSAIDPIHSPEAGLPQVIRGGNWNNNYDSCHVAHRTFHQPTDRHGNIGFRVVLSVDAVQRQLAKKPETNSWHGWPADAPAPAIAPFDAEQAKKHQEEWAAYLKVPVEYTNSIGMKFRLIPPGEFLMGSTPEEIEAALPIAGDDQTWQDCIRSEGPRHKVILTQPFYLGTSEVTQSQFQRIMETNPSLFSQGGEWADSVQSLDTANFPVETVEWEAAREFCQQLVRREGLQPAATTTNGIRFPFGPDPYRLPSEAEWEFACRAGSTTQFSTGENSADLTKIGWFDDNSMERTHQTGELPANGFGLHDMHGNVWEWVLDDWLSDSYTARAEQPTINPIGPQTKNSEHMTRGGNWVSYAEACRSASRSSASSAYDSSLIGFRVAMSVDAVRDLMRRESDKNNTPLSSNNPDQKLAEWVIAQGGSVTLSVSDDSQTRVLRNLKSIDELPKQPFVVGDIFLIGLSSIDDDAVNTLRGLCPQGSLYVLELRDTSISDRAVERLAGMSIRYLGMSETRITDKCVQALPLIRDLSQLHLGGTRISDPACATLSEMKNIEFLGLGGTRITAEGVKQISRLPALSRLEIMSNPQIDDDALKALAEHPTLRTLLVTSTSVTDVGVSALKNPRLEHIELANNSQITPAGLSALSHLVSLRGFNLDNVPTAVTDERISVLSQLPRLTYLQVSKTSLTDLCIPELSRLRNLQLLNINSTKITANGVARLSEALPQCQIHWDGGVIKPHGTESDRKVAEWILGQGGQVEIEYEGRPQILVAGDPIPDSPFLIKTIATITAQMTPEFLHELGQLRGIYKINAVNSRLNDGDTEVIAKLSLLNHLNLHNTEIGDAGLEALSALPQVGFLGIAETNVTADGLKHLKNLISLESVAISPYQLTPVSIQYLNALPRLTTLGLGSAADSDLELLQQLSQVKVLDLNYGSTKLTKTGIENLHRAMPHCRIEWDGGIVEPLQTSDTGWHGWPVDAPAPAIAPFDANQAKAHQEAWAKYLGVPVEYENSLGMKFRLIPPGEFLMGSTPEEIEAALKVAGEDEGWRERINSEAPQHKVVLTQPVYVGVTEVTQTQYEQVMGSNPSHFSATGEGKDAVANLETGNHPVEMVGWNDAAEFCAKLSQQEQLKPFYFRSGETVTPLEGTGYRLPTEAEWESACRAGTTTRFWSGDKDQDLVSAGWFGSNSGGRTHAAGELKANPFGLSDVHGNVWEWVQDSWDANWYRQFPGKPAVNPNSLFSAGSQRVIRGGNWTCSPSHCRSSLRHASHPPARHYLGFRVVLPLDAVIAALNAQVR